MVDRLDESNFLLYAAKNYENAQCFDTVEFYEDLKRFKYIKRLFNRYLEEGDLKERLILNHIIVIYNVFEPVAATRLLFFKLKGMENLLLPFLELLSYLPERIDGIGIENKTVVIKNIEPDQAIRNALKKI